MVKRVVDDYNLSQCSSEDDNPPSIRKKQHILCTKSRFGLLNVVGCLKDDLCLEKESKSRNSIDPSVLTPAAAGLVETIGDYEKRHEKFFKDAYLYSSELSENMRSIEKETQDCAKELSCLEKKKEIDMKFIDIIVQQQNVTASMSITLTNELHMAGLQQNVPVSNVDSTAIYSELFKHAISLLSTRNTQCQLPLTTKNTCDFEYDDAHSSCAKYKTSDPFSLVHSWKSINDANIMFKLQKVVDGITNEATYTIGSNSYKTTVIKRDSDNKPCGFLQVNILAQFGTERLIQVSCSTATKKTTNNEASIKQQKFEEILLGKSVIDSTTCKCVQSGWSPIPSTMLSSILQNNLDGNTCVPSSSIIKWFRTLCEEFVKCSPIEFDIDIDKCDPILKPFWLKQVIERALHTKEQLFARVAAFASLDGEYDQLKSPDNISGILKNDKKSEISRHPSTWEYSVQTSLMHVPLSFDGLHAYGDHNSKNRKKCKYPKGTMVLCLLISPCCCKCAICVNCICKCRGSFTYFHDQVNYKTRYQGWNKARNANIAAVHNPFSIISLGLLVGK